MSQGLAGGHPGARVPIQTSLNEVQEERVITALECSLEGLGSRRTSRFASSRLTTMKDGGAVGQRAGHTVPGITLAGDEVLGTFTLFQEFCRWHSQQLHDARQLVCLILQCTYRLVKETYYIQSLTHLISEVRTSSWLHAFTSHSL